ncbi:MAG: HDIG domain-containing protein [Planctomycetes bacterium]|nr:HDIG domain-containing protein [Planctomycetota bacterium]
MAFWNRKRSRPHRVDRLHPEGDVPWYGRLKSPQALRQGWVMLGFLAVALLVVQAPRPPLAFRQGDKITNPILARVDFEYIDYKVMADVRELTSLLRVPGLYAPDARQAIALRESLLALVDEVAKAATLRDLTESARSAWKVDEGMFAAIKQALGNQAENLTAVQETIAKATAALADPMSLPIVREEDYQRASARIARFRDLRTKLPPGLPPAKVPILEEPAAAIVTQLPEGDKEVPLQKVITVTQTDRIQTRLQGQIEGLLTPLFGKSGVGLLAITMAPQVGPTLTYDATKTENRRTEVKRSVASVPIPRKAGTTLVEAGSVITEDDLRILGQEQEARLAALGWLQGVLTWVGAGAVLAILILFVAGYTVRFQPLVARSIPRTLLLAVLCLLVVGASKAAVQTRWPMESCTLLVTAAAMIITIAYTETYALAMSWALVLLVAVATRADLDWTLTTVAGTGVAVLALGEINNRSKLIKVGALAGLVFFVARVALALWRLDYADAALRAIVTDVVWPYALYFGVGLMAGIIMLAILPFIERVFGIVTNISLLELCDVNQPALKRLALEAPGTYAHSLLIGTLAEAAAEAIGVNGLLARVGAYFHDIGKANKPRYFIENYQEGQESHNGLAPAMSRLIIMSHIKDGLEMADRLALPPIIRSFIAEHHGTTLMEYFYHEARRQAEAAGTDVPDESEYRYPGPKPHSPETAIVMLADGVEGATRSLKERTATRVGATVRDMVMKRLLSGQLDDSGLALNDLRKVEETLTKTLLSVYHGRVPYPGQREAEDVGDAPHHESEAAAEAGTVGRGDKARPAGPEAPPARPA